MEPFPFDRSHPAVRDYVNLVRLQVLTPLSLLINIAAVLVCHVFLDPNLGKVSRMYPTSISPNAAVIGVYVVVLYMAQIGYCLLLVMASKPETKRSLTKGVGLSLVFANWVMAGWAVAWAMRWFRLAAVLQGLLLLLLLYPNIALLIYHPSTFSHPMEMGLIHAPLRFFLVLPLSILFPLTLFVALGLAYNPPTPGDPPVHYSNWHAWLGFAVVFSTNLFSWLVIVIRKDLIWCIAAVWACVSIWSQRPKPGPVNGAVIAFTALHPIGLVVAFLFSKFYSGEGGVRLRGGEGDLHRNREQGAGVRRAEESPGGREVEEGEVWG